MQKDKHSYCIDRNNTLGISTEQFASMIILPKNFAGCRRTAQNSMPANSATVVFAYPEERFFQRCKLSLIRTPTYIILPVTKA